MYLWPQHYPQQCPPQQAIPASGKIYRFINGKSPLAKDFQSHYEREPSKIWEPKECQARGLSVLRTLDDCAAMREAVPALRKKRITEGVLTQSDGVTLITPSHSCKAHTTWWRLGEPDTFTSRFHLHDETTGEKNV